jgi:hypothetical protein
MKQELLASIAVLALGMGLPTRLNAAEYVYTDDFSTMKVANDSYQHDTLCDGPPQVITERFIVRYNEALYFYTTYWNGAPPELAYQFPLYFATNGIEDGVVSLSARTSLWCPVGESDRLEVMTSTDGQQWTSRYDLIDDFGGPHLISIDITDMAASSIYVKIRGFNMIIDDLYVRIHFDQLVGLHPADWGQVKQLYE